MFWKKKPKALLESPRDHHYTFAHVALRHFCASDPLQFFGIMGSEDAAGLFDFLWEKVCEQCDPSGPTGLKREDIRFHTLRIAEHPTVLVIMPDAQAVAEAIMVAVVLMADLGADEVPDPVPYRFLVLEQGADLDGTRRTVFCEWTEDAHLNMGDGCEPNTEAFVAFLEGKL